MADVTWPIGLPIAFLRSGYKETLPDVGLRTQMDAGPAKQRRRYTTNVTPIGAHIPPLDKDQVAIFKDFFKNSLAGGVLPFDHLDPLTHDAVEMRFICSPPPDIQALADSDLFDVNCNIEILP